MLLQKLDLYNNQLVSLPLEFWQLKKLKWLDLKDNPQLEPGLAKVAGTCVDEKECKECAKEVRGVWCVYTYTKALHKNQSEKIDTILFRY